MSEVPPDGQETQGASTVEQPVPTDSGLQDGPATPADAGPASATPSDANQPVPTEQPRPDNPPAPAATGATSAASRPSPARPSKSPEPRRASREPAAGPGSNPPLEVVNGLPAQGTGYRSSSRAAAAPSLAPDSNEPPASEVPSSQRAPSFGPLAQQQEAEAQPEPAPAARVEFAEPEPVEQRAASPEEDLNNDVENVAVQLRDLKAKNADLIQALEVSQQEADMRRDLAEAATQLHANDKQSIKIIELSKKNRALHLAVEREKQKVVNLTAELDMLKRASFGQATSSIDAQGIEEACRSVVEAAAQGAEEAHREAARWKERWEAQLNKMNQLEVKMAILKQEKERLMRVLQLEVGEDVPLAKLLDGTSNWRGRQQQITLLKEKIKEMTSLQGSATVKGPEPSRFDTAHRATLEAMRAEKQREVDRMADELAAAQRAQHDLKLRCEAAVARRGTIETENKALRDKMAVLLDKTANDDKLISALRTELAAFRQARRTSGDASGAQLLQRLDLLERQQAEQLAQIGRQEKIIWSLQAAHAGQ